MIMARQRRRETMGWIGVLLAGLFLLGCSHQDRYGRDPAKLSKESPRRDEAKIEVARAKAVNEETGTGNEEGDITPAPVLFINGEALTVDDVLKWIRPELEELAANSPPGEYQQLLMERLGAELRSRAESCMLVQEARKELKEPELERLDAFVDKRIRELVNTEHGGRESRYHEFLRQRGITPAEDRARITDDILVAAYLQKAVAQRVTEPTRRELEQFHDEYVAKLRAEQKRHMLLIDLPYGDTDATGRRVSVPVPREDALKRARRAREKLSAGADFREIAREYSEGIHSYNGGDWGWLTPDGVKPRWQPAVDALFRLDAGQTSDLIETPAAIFIVRCAALEDLEVLSFTEMQPRLIEAYRNQQFQLMTRELLAELHATADIRPENPGRFLLSLAEAAPRPGPAAVQ